MIYIIYNLIVIINAGGFCCLNDLLFHPFSCLEMVTRQLRGSQPVKGPFMDLLWTCQKFSCELVGPRQCYSNGGITSVFYGQLHMSDWIRASHNPLLHVCHYTVHFLPFMGVLKKSSGRSGD